jgi:hypothetical protein
MAKAFLASVAFIALTSSCVGSTRPALAAGSGSPTPAAAPSSAVSASPAPGPTVDPAITAKAKEWLHRFQTGDLDRSQLSSQMNTALTTDVVKQLKDELSPLGDAQSFKITSQQSLGEGITAYVYRVAFQSSSIDEIIAFDSNGKISGFRLTPVQ